MEKWEVKSYKQYIRRQEALTKAGIMKKQTKREFDALCVLPSNTLNTKSSAVENVKKPAKQRRAN